MTDSPRLGVDLGGTKIEAVVLEVEEHGYAEHVRRRIPTPQVEGYEAIVRAAAGLIGQVAGKAGLRPVELPVGVGMPGGIRRDGMVKNSNTTCLNGRPFRQDLVRAVGQPIAYENDANCFALAETHFGAARDYRRGVVFGVILGTGVGGGLVIDGRVRTGPMGIAGEWGHHTVYAIPPGDRNDVPLRPCYCGKTGCVEVYASGPAVEKDYAARSGQHRRMEEIVALRDTDPHAKLACDVFLDAFARGMANVIDVIDPDAVVLGGGLSQIECLYTEGVDRIASLVFNEHLATPVLRPRLGDAAGVVGAALLESPSRSR